MLHPQTVYPKKIDEEICDCMDLAERKCRKFCMGAINFLPTYKAAAVQTVELRKRRLACRSSDDYKNSKDTGTPEETRFAISLSIDDIKNYTRPESKEDSTKA